MRIYEISPNYHIDLGKIVAVRQYVCRNKKKDKYGNPIYDCWIEITIDNGSRNIEVDCTIEDIQETYQMLVRAWSSFVGDYDGQQPGWQQFGQMPQAEQGPPDYTYMDMSSF